MTASPAAPAPEESPAIAAAKKTHQRNQRLIMGHFICYPITLPWVIALIPLLIHLNWEELMKLPDDDAVSDFVLSAIKLPALGLFLLPHTFVIPWARSAPDSRGKGLFIGLAVAYGLIGLFCAGIGWGYILTGRA